MYRIRVQNKWWQFIAAKRKTVEVRIFKDAHAHVVPGDKIEITNIQTSQKLFGTVGNVTIYPTFESMFQHEGLIRVLPGINSIQDGINVYYSIGNYKHDELLYGVVAIELFI